jgi:hypothetical protein
VLVDKCSSFKRLWYILNRYYKSDITRSGVIYIHSILYRYFISSKRSFDKSSIQIVKEFYQKQMFVNYFDTRLDRYYLEQYCKLMRKIYICEKFKIKSNDFICEIYFFLV